LGTDSNGPFGSGYYDTSKTYHENQRVGANIKEAISDFNMESFIQNALGSKGSTYSYSGYFNNPKMIRVSRIWWISQKRVGLLYVAKNGEITKVDTLIDENYVVTEEPTFDKSLLNEESERTIVSGEYVKWTYVPEWRYAVKIGENVPYYVVNPTKQQICIYLEGDPLPFQRKGSRNTYDARPPIEGRRISEKNTVSVGFIEGLKPWQIVYNVVNNKILRLMPDDIGPILVANESAMNTNSLYNQDGRAPLFEFLDNLRDNKVLINKDLQTGIALNGKSVQPTILDISTVDKMKTYLELGSMIKLEAYESIGLSRERLASVQASQSATGINQAVQSSINQTEIFFDIFSNKFMPRVWQMIIDYGQYYTTQKDTFSDTYINGNLEKVMFSIIKDELLLKDLHVYAFSKANMRKLMNDLKMLMMQDNTMGASFLDKIKGLNSSTPSEIIEKLEKAEFERQENDRQIREMDIQKQREQQDFLDKQAKEAEQKEDERFYAKLENDRYIGEVRAMGFGNNPDVDANQIPDVLEVETLRAKNEQFSTNAMLKNRHLRIQEQVHKDNVALKREDQAIKRESNASKERIAIENKQSADLQFQEKMKQQKAKQK
jgi:hypothetical protein